jgi:predicted SprT family Zn-dependent metalloprotease
MITLTEYKLIDDSYNWFNKELFEDKLPDCLITLQRRAHSAGYFSPNRFQNRKSNNKKIDEIALNPGVFKDQSDLEILSTLVHEMMHLWQKYQGKPSRTGYHNREWADKIEIIGLMPSSTGKEGGKKTGQKMSDYIIKGGPFEASAQKLINTGFAISWQSIEKRAEKPDGTTPPTPKKRIKFKCQGCNLFAWAKPETKLKCGTCDTLLLPENL